jgi:hypothetical protein
MNQAQIDAVLAVYGPSLKWVDGQIGGIPGEGWFILTANPLPPKHERIPVITDIAEGRYIRVSEDAQVRHVSDCEGTHLLSQKVQQAVSRLQPKTFQVSIHPGIPGLLSGQPVAISIEPEISYMSFPDHPHLNMGAFLQRNGKTFFLPDSFCYVTDIADRYEEPVERMIHAVAHVTEWLLRHMVWEQAKSDVPSLEAWLGPQEGMMDPYQYANALNPAGPCRCGSRRTYHKCHYHSDIREYLLITNPDFQKVKDPGELVKHMMNITNQCQSVYENRKRALEAFIHNALAT